MFQKIKNSEKLKNFTKQATAAYNKAKTTEIHLGRKKEAAPPVIIEYTTEQTLQTSENADIINLLCLFAFKYQHRWTNGKKHIIEQYCETVDDNNYFTQLRVAEEQGYALFNAQNATQLFSTIRITHTAISFDHWAEFQQKLLTDILHLLALSGCNAEEVLRESVQLSNTWCIGEDVCQIAYNRQQTAQNNHENPYNLPVSKA